MRKERWDKKAWEDYEEFKQSNKSIANKIDELLEDIQHNPFSGLGKPKRLKGNKGWRRKITKKDRLVYDVVDDLIIIYACRNHYE